MSRHRHIRNLDLDDEYYEDDYSDYEEAEELEVESSEDDNIYEAYDPTKHQPEFDTLEYKISQIQQIITKPTQDVREALKRYGTVEGAVEHLLKGNHISEISFEEGVVSCVVHSLPVIIASHPFQPQRFQDGQLKSFEIDGDSLSAIPTVDFRLDYKEPENMESRKDLQDGCQKTITGSLTTTEQLIAIDEQPRSIFSGLSLSKLSQKSVGTSSLTSLLTPKEPLKYNLKSLKPAIQMPDAPRQIMGLKNLKLHENSATYLVTPSAVSDIEKKAQLATPSAYARFLTSDIVAKSHLNSKLTLFRSYTSTKRCRTKEGKLQCQ